jgi:lipoyl(octanoyl) transferase
MGKLIHDIVQVALYRQGDDEPEYLLLKRVPADGGFWQPVTGHIEPGETQQQALLREVGEETGIVNVLELSDMLHEYSYDLRGEPGRDTVYAAAVAPDSVVQLSPGEHEDYVWLPLEQALERLKYDGNKTSLRKVHQHITKHKR